MKHVCCLLSVLVASLLPAISISPTEGRARAHEDLAELRRSYAAARDAYLERLRAHLPEAYKEHLANLRPADIATVAATRRLWHWYIEAGPFTMGDPRKQRTGIFRQEFLDPIDRVAEILLIDPAALKDTDVRSARAKAYKAAERLDRAYRSADVNIDPTAGKTAPTGVPIPHLDHPHTSADALRLYERTLVLARTVAHPEAEPVLMQNAAACLEIDLMEADFVMYANQVRMLSGSIAWVVDPLMTACCRDHSQDRKAGDASGHQSNLPDKRFPRDRARRFGCRVGPEGAGGGRDGRGALRGFAYNGTGHGGPLFAQLRNVVGPGWREGVLTALYQTDERHRHACAATEGELVLPPGITNKMLSPANGKIFRALAQGRFADAAELLEARAPRDEFQRAIRRNLEARLDAEIDWTLTGIEHILDAGDVFEAQRRLDLAERSMKGLSAFDGRARVLAKRMSTKAARRELEIGRVYHQIIGAKKLEPELLQQLVDKHPESTYAAAAAHCLQADRNAFWPELFYFVMQDSHLNKWSYLHSDRVGGRR